MDREKDATFYDYLFLRRINSAVKTCGDNGYLFPVFILFRINYIVLWLSLVLELVRSTVLRKNWSTRLLWCWQMVFTMDKLLTLMWPSLSKWLRFTIILETTSFLLTMDWWSVKTSFELFRREVCLMSTILWLQANYLKIWKIWTFMA